ncbi:hypothetical protein G6O67_001074 [Ophiocordyceps sinensis]|uniref:3-hydroxyisobutyryl-coenzyme A hydrolase n=1 Tax=Ophiocordyceps sinensis TaxID=72228 RepID=A0A8H4PWP6_9HYPO|nr:hypothetical protein G6O67_001074 [Ophiocordyceps sinensis]
MAAPQLAGYSYTHFAVTSPRAFVAHVEINRADKLNVFSRPMWLEFGRVFRQLSGDAEVRAVVLSGAGERAFTAGLDVRAAADEGPLAPGGADGHGGGDAARAAKALRGHIDEFQGCIAEMERCEKPVICVLHGISLGLAIDIACCADVRVCSLDTRFAVKEVDIGLAADVGTLARLPKIVGSTSWVKDVCLSARDFSASEALGVGFVSQVHEGKAAALEAGLAMAGGLAGKSPVAVQGTKELLNYGREHATADSLRYTTVWNSVALQAGDVTAAMAGVFGKRKPTFEKL